MSWAVAIRVARVVSSGFAKVWFVLLGDLDRSPAIDCAEQTAARIGRELIRLPGVDHLPPLRAPGAILHLVEHVTVR